MRKPIIYIVIIVAVVIGTLYGLFGEPSDAEAKNPDDKNPIETSSKGLNNDEIDDNKDIISGTNPVIIIDEEFKVLASEKYGQKLVEDGTMNILMVGEDQKNNLYDTIGIINIDKENKKIKLIMIPRDMYMDYSEPIIDFLRAENKLDEPGYLKLNAAHFIGVALNFEGKFNWKSMNFLNQIFIEKFDIDFDDFIKVNKDAVRDIVNIFGGVTIDVPYAMNYDDIYQDLFIHIEKGEQVLNGEQAEGFVRFRQGLNEDGEMVQYGDIARKENQIMFMKAFIKQHGTLANVTKIPELLSSLSENVKHSIGFGDLLSSYLKLANDVIKDKYDIESVVLNGELTKINGSSYLIIK